MSEGFDYVFKVLLVGDAAVGKSSILSRFVNDSFQEDMNATVGVDFKKKTMRLAGKKVLATIWDTAGQERFRTLTSGYYRNSKGVILVYDVTNRTSLENIREWLTEVDNFSTHSVVKLLVGNKIDLPNRTVSRDEGAQFARQHGMLFIECSAKTNEGVSQAFEELVLQILERPQLLENASPIKLSGNPEPAGASSCAC